MFLSKVDLQPSTQMAVELAKLNKNGVYSAHQLLWRLFTNEPKRNFLYRQEIGGGGMPYFYLLSTTTPDVDNMLFKIQTKTFIPNLRVGQRLAFKLRANPTVCLTNENGDSQRHDVLMHAKKKLNKDKSDDASSNSALCTEIHAAMNKAAQKWFTNETRLKNWGIMLNIAPEIQTYVQHKSRKKNGQSIQFSSVDYEGILTIKNPEIFLEQYEKGFGRAKALGCGLMLIRPL